MLFSSRISTRKLGQLCRRLGISLTAGIDLRTVWTREAEQAAGSAAQSRFRSISEDVNAGSSLHAALIETDGYFPEMFLEIVDVGEQTGHLAETFAQLADHYEEQVVVGRIFLAACTWPLIQLAFAIGIVGFLIWVMGIINPDDPEAFDPLGLGLVGNEGLAVYCAFLVFIGFVLFLLYQAFRRGLVWTKPIQRAVTRVPVIGGALEAIAMSRLAWSMHLTLDSGMNLRRAMGLCLRSTRNSRYTDHAQSIDQMIEQGQPLYDAFRQTGDFPTIFLDTVRVGEQSGSLVESMERLSVQYRQQADAAFKVLAVAGGFAVWMVVAALIVVLIFRLVLVVYIGPIYDALDAMP